MTHREVAERLAASLTSSFAEALRWNEREEDARPADGGWSVREICEHLTLVHQYLLILVEKIRTRSLKRLAAGERPRAEPSRLEQLEGLASRERAWSSPEHMLPGGALTRDEIRERLEADRARCLALLRELPDGEGTLHTIRFSPADARLDLYQFLGVIDLHLRRHLAQMRRGYE